MNKNSKKSKIPFKLFGHIQVGPISPAQYRRICQYRQNFWAKNFRRYWSPPVVDLGNAIFKDDVIHDAPKEICHKNHKRLGNSAILAHSAIWALEVF